MPLLFASLRDSDTCPAVRSSAGADFSSGDEKLSFDFDFVLLDVLLEYDCAYSERS
jgi:hypothetical protein